MFEGTFSPPVYNDLYNFLDGSQDDIFEDSYLSLPTPEPNGTLPVLNGTLSGGVGPIGGLGSLNGSVSTPLSATSSFAVPTTSTSPPASWYRRDLRRSNLLAHGRRLVRRHQHGFGSM